LIFLAREESGPRCIQPNLIQRYFAATSARDTERTLEGQFFSMLEKGERMRLRRTVVMLAAAVSVSFAIPSAISTAYAASATPTAATSAAVETAPNTAQIPAIQFRDCSGQTTTWVDLDMLTASGLQDWCFGYTGTWLFNVPNNNVTFFCSGNNIGYYYYTRNGVMQPAAHFGPGYNVTFASNDRMKSLTITGWQGTYRCRS
jgi:hypothetical protein